MAEQEPWVWPWQRDPEPKDPLQPQPQHVLIRNILNCKDTHELAALWEEVMERWHTTSDREHLHWTVLCTFAEHPQAPPQAHQDIFRLGGWAAHMAQTALGSSVTNDLLHQFSNLKWKDIKSREGYADKKRGEENLHYIRTRAVALLAKRAEDSLKPPALPEEKQPKRLVQIPP